MISRRRLVAAAATLAAAGPCLPATSQAAPIERPAKTTFLGTSGRMLLSVPPGKWIFVSKRPGEVVAYSGPIDVELHAVDGPCRALLQDNPEISSEALNYFLDR